MAKKRANGEGTIYKMPSGKWRAQFPGPLRTRMSFVGETQSECQSWLTKTKSEQLTGINMVGGKQRLSDFIPIWLQAVNNSRSRNTVRIYKETLRPVYKYLGCFSLNEIRPDHIQATYNKILASGGSTYSVRQIHKVLHVAFAFAKQLRVIARNPISDALPPRHIAKKMSCYDEKQVQALLFGALASQDKYYPLYYLAINTGMRQGELLGLKWKDIDWANSALRVERQLARYPDGTYEFRKPKSKRGLREIAIGKDVLDLLGAHISEQNIKSSEDRNWNKHDLVFPSLSGTPVNASNLRRSFRKLLKFTGLPKIRFHDLRHTAATLMLNYGTPIPVVSERLGHSKASMTLDTYAHAIPSKQVEAANLMQDLMAAETTPVAHALHTKHQ